MRVGEILIFFILKMRQLKPRECIYFPLVIRRPPCGFRTRIQIPYAKLRKNLVRESELRKQMKKLQLVNVFLDFCLAA